MNVRHVIGNVLKAPLLLLVIASFVASIYAASNQLFGISFGSSILLGSVIVLYIVGIILNHDWKKKETKDNSDSAQK